VNETTNVAQVTITKAQRTLPLDVLAREWAAVRGKGKNFDCFRAIRARQTSYEAACWGALADVGLHAEARALQVLVRDGAGSWTIPGLEELQETAPTSCLGCPGLGRPGYRCPRRED
jgi:hypothetical protein